jgi:hypothetical protein
VERKIHYNYQGREAVLSSTTRDREASMSAGIRSSKCLTEHVWCGRICSYFNILFFAIHINFPFSQFLLELLCTMTIHPKQKSPLELQHEYLLPTKSLNKTTFKFSRPQKNKIKMSNSKNSNAPLGY